MRFIPNGPSIPDALLSARDEGRVVFFCGAGVSLAKANLPDFINLTKQVILELGVGEDEPVSKLLRADQEIKDKIGESVLSIDRIFGLLERDFVDSDIESAVAKTLKLSSLPNLTAHQTMLKLAKTSEGITRLITTNFDRLFEASDPSLPYWYPPKLPNSNEHEFDGIIHLHGIVNEEYDGADGNGFILSSSEFGHAYLAEGWATQFIKTILEKYIVVFVGYSADDPPVRYLLEALNKRAHTLKGMYAFHCNCDGDAQNAWASKGVEPIVSDDYLSLWESMEAWAVRAENPNLWVQDVLSKAQKGPFSMQPHERGQVAHIVSTIEGMRKFSLISEPLPAEWLCVFDSALRYARPTRNFWDENSQTIDPLERYGLDSDTFIPVDPDDIYFKREVSVDAWNCFSLMDSDKEVFQMHNFSSLMGYNARNMPRLSTRLSLLGEWVMRVADDPVTVWWAIKQNGIHPEIMERIQHYYRYQKKKPEIEKLWQNLTKIWSNKDAMHDLQLHDLEEIFRNNQYNMESFLMLIDYYRPVLNVDTGSLYMAFPPVEKGRNIYDVVNFEIKYRGLLDIEIPDEYLVYYIKEFRYILERIVVLEKTLCRRQSSIDPINQEADPHHELSHDDKLSPYVVHFVNLIQRLIEKDISAAKQEFLSWGKDDHVFARLSVWISSEVRLFAGSEAANIILELDDGVFWDSYSQRDLLITLKKRWHDYNRKSRKLIEKRILQGRKQYKFEKDTEYLNDRSWQVLDYIYWLALEGCTLSFNLEKETQKLMKLAPNWKTEYAQKADRSLQGRGGSVRTNTNYDELLALPLQDILKKSMPKREEFLLEHRPFSGLSEAKPVRAFSALTNASKENKYPEWAWKTFLYAQSREADKIKFTTLIAARILLIPVEQVRDIMHPLIQWYEKIAKRLLQYSPDLFDQLWNRFIHLLTIYPALGESGIKSNAKHYEWVTHAINTPEGKLVDLLIDILPGDTTPDNGFAEKWIICVEQLLHLPQSSYRFALVRLSRNLNWFFYIDQEWTKQKLLPFLETSVDDKEAFFAGFLRSSKVPAIDLYQILKPHMLELAISNGDSKRFGNNLTGMLLIGWGEVDSNSSERLVSDNEMRSVLISSDENFRLMVLSNLLRWSREKSIDWEEKIPLFLKKVWPRHKKAKSALVLARICDLVLSNERIFPKVIDDLIKLLKGSSVGQIQRSGFQILDNTIIDEYPEKVLDLLFTILSDNTQEWPYMINNVLDKIVKTNSSLRTNSKFIELQRRWNSR
jgi:hypothetical protein